MGSAGGTMLIKTNIVDGNNADELITGTSYGVKIESSCVEDGTATLDELEKTTTSGEIRFTYTADGCLQDSFSADLYTVVDGEIATKITDDAITGVIYVHPVEIGAIIFDSVSETYISLKNIGDAVLPKQSIVTFTVLDEIGGPIVGQVVDFELNNTTGGITLGSGEVTDSDVTDSNGQVTVIINSSQVSIVITGTNAGTSPGDRT